MLKKGEKEYYYLYNSQNDVIGLIDSDGKQVVNYSYDAWGKQTGLTDTSGENIGKLNPFRYRAYCYDDDTKLYVTASRYYDPEVGRFVNADRIKFAATLGRYYVNRQNLYQYCFNNPIMLNDKFGSWPKLPEWLDDLGKSAKKAAKANCNYKNSSSYAIECWRWIRNRIYTKSRVERHVIKHRCIGIRKNDHRNN